MKRLFYLIIFLSLLVSCKDHIDIDTFSNKSKMVVYCFPTVSDTTYIQVSRSVPVRNYSDSVRIVFLDDAAIDYRVNGLQKTAQPLGKGYYRITGRQKVGDRISLQVSCDGLPSVSASTIIPDTVAISPLQVRTVSIYDSDYGDAEKYNQLVATFTNDPKTHCYYAVRVRQKNYTGSAIGYYNHGNRKKIFSDFQDYEQYKDAEDWDSVSVVFTDSVCSYPVIDTKSEDLLMPMSDIDDAFGFSNDFYQNFCIFDNASIKEKTYTLHLNMNSNDVYVVYKDPAPVYYDFAKAYQVELIRLTPEYYHFLQSLNEIENNEMARNGLSQIRPTASNIVGGLGVEGGWNTARTNWTKKE